MMYGEFASVYDALMVDVDYQRWARYILELARQNEVTVARAVDCACGTGNFTVALAKSDIQITGVDLSAEMLQIAGEKSRSNGLRIPFILQDMRKLSLHRPVDAVFCVLDGVNYLTRPCDVKAFFRSAYQALRPGGGLFFDISSYHKLADCLGDRCLGNDGERISYIWQNHFDAGTRVLQMDLTFFVKESNGMYRRFSETHFQRAHHADETAMWLTEESFQNIHIYGDQTFEPPTRDEERIHFVAVKRNGEDGGTLGAMSTT